MKKKSILAVLFLYLVVLVLFTYFSRTISFHDTYEYVTLTKDLAGIHNINVYSTHSLIFPFFASQILRMFPDLFVLKLLGSIWLFFTALLVYFYSKNEKALLLFAFSPIAWFISIQYTPIIPSAFFILLAYVLFKRYEQNGSKISFLFSGISSGIAISIYYPALSIILFFILVFMFDKKFYVPFSYIIILLVSLMPEFILNYIFFKMPFYSLIRYFGINALVLAGRSFNVGFIYFYWVLIPFAITPFLYKLLGVDFKRFRKELLFILLSAIFFAVRGGDLKYFYLFAPIVLLLVSQAISKKEVKLNSLISLVLIIVLTYSYFGNTPDTKITKDLEEIKSEYPSSQYLTSDNRASMFASFSWNSTPKFIWLWEYEFENENKTITSSYEINSIPQISSDKLLSINIQLIKNNKIIIDDPVYLIAKRGDEVSGNFKFIKSYDMLDIYEK